MSEGFDPLFHRRGGRDHPPAMASVNAMSLLGIMSRAGLQENPDTPASPGVYSEIRALQRGLKVIEALSKLGWSSPNALAKETGLDRSTVYRLLATLSHLGYIDQRPEDRHYILSAKVVEIASGVRADDGLSSFVAPVLASLVQDVHWPSDFAVFSGGVLRIMATNHHLTSMSVFRGLIGKSMPMLQTALGRAILSAMHADECEMALLSMPRLNGAVARAVPDRANIDRMLDDTRKAGYASAGGIVEDLSIGTIALPVMRDRSVAGAINLVFFRSAMSTEEAAERYLEKLRAAVATIEARIAS